MDTNGNAKQFPYDETKSTTSKKTELTADIKFGSGSLGGHFYTDTLSLGSCSTGGLA